MSTITSSQEILSHMPRPMVVIVIVIVIISSIIIIAIIILFVLFIVIIMKVTVRYLKDPRGL